MTEPPAAVRVVRGSVALRLSRGGCRFGSFQIESWAIPSPDGCGLFFRLFNLGIICHCIRGERGEGGGFRRVVDGTDHRPFAVEADDHAAPRGIIGVFQTFELQAVMRRLTQGQRCHGTRAGIEEVHAVFTVGECDAGELQRLAPSRTRRVGRHALGAVHPVSGVSGGHTEDEAADQEPKWGGKCFQNSPNTRVKGSASKQRVGSDKSLAKVSVKYDMDVIYNNYGELRVCGLFTSTYST